LVLTGGIVFLANAALLVLQLVAGRLLAPYIGSSLATWTSIIGMFLAGISAGNWVGGRVADRAPSGRTLRRLLWIGAACVFATVGLARLLGNGSLVRPVPLYPRIALLSLLLCFPPAFTLSMTTPVAIKLMLPDVRQTGRVVGLVYALGTLGSLVGNFVTGFVLMAYFGVAAIVLATGALLVVLGLVVPPGTAAPVGESAGPADRGRPAVDPAEGLSLPAACAVVFLASFCSMALEIAASRLLAPTLGVSIYTWTGIIGVVLAGVVAGNYLGGRVADRSPKRDTLSSTLFWCGLFSLLILVTYRLAGQYSGQFEEWLKGALSRPDAGSGGEAVAQFVHKDWFLPLQIVTYAAALFFLPMVAFGAVSPQATRLAVRDWDHAGRVAGRVYAWSCAGAIAGTFAAGWLLIGRFGVLPLVLGISALMILLALPVGTNWRRPMELVGTGLVLGAVVVAAWAGAEQYLRLKSGSTYYKESNYYLTTILSKDEADTERDFVLDHLIHSHVRGAWAEEDGRPVWKADVGHLGYGHEQAQSEFARVAAARHANPNVLVIGGGGYTLPRWIDHYLPAAHVEVVEIDPAVTEAVYEALGMPRDTKIRSFNLDGRQFVQEIAEPGQYHLVIQDAVNDLSVPYHIMTREYNDAVRRTLAADGVYLLTVIDNYPDGRLLPAALRTMRETFPHVYLLAEEAYWDGKPQRSVWVIAGAAGPIDFDAMKVALAQAGVADMVTKVMPAEKLDAYLKAARPVVLTDDFAPVDNLIAETFRRR
jgi:MFS family permease